MTLSIAWITPFGPKSDIGAFSRNLLNELALRAEQEDLEVTVFINENGPSYWSSFPCVNLTGKPIDVEIISSFDIIIYNIGNNKENHQHINSLALKIPGLVIVHDLIMQHYLAWYYFEHVQRKDLYARMMGQYYSAAGIEVVRMSQICSTRHEPIYAPWDSPHVPDYPLLEPFVKAAAAIVVHSAYAMQHVTNSAQMPALQLRLPWDQKPSLSESDLQRWIERTSATGSVQITAFGHIVRTKCLETILAAFSVSPVLMGNARFSIVGYPADHTYLEELRTFITQHGLSHVVRVELEVSDERLLQIKDEADVFINLRYPNTESASGSLTEQLNSGKPVVIFPTGAYAEVPSEACVPIDRELGPHGLATALENITMDPSLRIAIGAAGREFVRTVGRSEYIKQLLGFVRGNQNLLRHRKSFRSGYRGSYRPKAENEVEIWLHDLIVVRRMLALSEMSNHVIDPSPFVEWDLEALWRYISAGVFGQTAGSDLEKTIRSLVSTLSRHDLFFTIVDAMSLVRLAQKAHEAAFEIGYLEPVLNWRAWDIVSKLEPKTLAHCCYVGLLGRAPDLAEEEAYTSRIIELGPFVCINEILHSEEARARIKDADAANSLSDFCAKALTRPRTFIDLPIGRDLDFNSDGKRLRHILQAGWHGTETNCVWSSGRSAFFCFRFKSPVDLPFVVFDFRFCEDGQTDGRSILVKENNSVKAKRIVIDDAVFSIRVDLETSNWEGFVVEIICDRTVNLFKANLGNDTRDLGVCLLKVYIGGDS